MSNSATPALEAIAECCNRIDALCTPLVERAWRTPTALPGWDVHDVVAHLGSLESMLMGREEPEHVAADTGHVRNDLGHLNERLVDRRRPWTGAEVLAEFRETTRLRLDAMAALDEAGLDAEVPSPTGGTVPLRNFLGVRVWDYFVHVIDISDALGEAVDVDCSAGRRMLDEMLFLLPRAVAKGGAAEGELVRLDITEPLQRAAAARVEGGRGGAVDPAAGEAALHLRASPVAFLRVGAGRVPAADAIGSGEVSVSGDRPLAERILNALNVVP